MLAGVAELGFAGSDVLEELPLSTQEQLTIEPIVALAGMRFGLVARNDRVGVAENKLNNGELLRISTGYPRIAERIAARTNLPLKVEATATGLTEELLYQFPEIDASIELIDTGRTLREYDLCLVRDNLQPVNLCALWPRGLA